ncbi:MAG: 30S ribosomal protein S16 [Patescibacteria group bacterium]
MLKIRFQRFGRKHQPAFRLVVTESTRGPKSGNFIEVLGNHNPDQKDVTQLDADRIKYWISKGAKLSPTVHNLLITERIIEGKKVNVLPRKTPLVSEDSSSSQEASTQTVSKEENSEKETTEEEPREESVKAEDATGDDAEKKEDENDEEVKGEVASAK